MYIKGIYKKTIYNSENYTVGLLKVKESDYEGLTDKTITFTGYFDNINIDDHLKLIGDFTHHYKYGDQFLTNSYEMIIPEEKDGLVTFLSSDLFPGVGEMKAQKIYDTLGKDVINIILNDPSSLQKVKGLSKKNIETIITNLQSYQESIDTIVKLNDFGFSNKDSTNLYHKYKNKTIDIITNNIYDIIDEDFTYKKIDNLALRHAYDIYDKRRIKATICYVIQEVNNNMGDTYLYYNEVYDYLIRCLESSISFPLFEECINELISENKIIQEDDKYYLTKMYYAEKNIAKRFVYLNNKKENDIKKIKIIFDKIQIYNNITYNEKQEEAIINSFASNFMIITGGPGTGKTTIIKSIVDIYKELNKKNLDGIENKVTLLAPTGRASKRLMESVNFKAQTIHRFLKWNKDNNTFAVNEYNKVRTEVVIIDEASMIDTLLMDNLLKGLYYDTKIILVGDFNQLPSVGPGEILKDLITTQKFLVVELNKLYRQKENSNIYTFAYDINNNIYNSNLLNMGDDLEYIESDNYNTILKFSELCYQYQDYNYNEIAILAPMYKTVNGIDNLNLIAKEIFNPKKDQNEIVIGDTKYREGDKVIELINMPDDNVYNGDMGIIIEIDNTNKEIYIDYDGNIVKYTKNNFYNFKLGYVTSIHKAQGSEYKTVIIVLLKEFGRMLYRKLLYTGVTRAREKLIILGEKEAIEKSIENNSLVHERKTSLMDMINKMYEEIRIE